MLGLHVIIGHNIATRDYVPQHPTLKTSEYIHTIKTDAQAAANYHT